MASNTFQALRCEPPPAPVTAAAKLGRLVTPASARQGLTLVHFSSPLEPCLTHKNTLNALNTS